MSWIKRNLYFVVGSVVAVGLLVVAVVYYLQKESANQDANEKINAAYAELKRINDLVPHPGYQNSGSSTSKVDNLKIGQEQIHALSAFLRKSRTAFEPVPAIPANDQLSGQEFTAELLRTIDQMRRAARGASVKLPSTNYNFTFDSIVPKVAFNASSLKLLSRQLGQVKTISDVLVAAKINAVEGFRRVKVCPEDDPTKYPSDYLSQTPQTNTWAEMEPFELTLRCFSAELAGVLAGFANSPHGIIVKTINIEAVPPAEGAAFGAVEGEGAPPPALVFVPPPTAGMLPGGADMDMRMRRRYGDMAMPNRAPAYVPPPVVVRPGASASRSTPPVLFEQAVRVTLNLVFVQLKSDNPDGEDARGRRRPGRRSE